MLTREPVNMGDAMKAIGYIRVSTETQVREGQGLAVQKGEIKKYCKAHKLDLVKIY
jgi:DNA invertase Pin-like site-specific DNA recombinase